MGVERVTTHNLKVVQTDVERGLILVEGAVPGAKGGWIMVRDAVKKALPEGRAEARQVPLPRGAAPPPRPKPPPKRRRARDMELKVTTLDGKAAGSVDAQRRHLRPRAAQRPDPALRRLAARQAPAPAPTRSRTAREINRTGKKMYKQKGTGGARHGSRARRLFRGGGTVVRSGRAQPRDRPAEEGAGARAAAMRCRPRRRTAASSCSTTPTVEGRQDQGAARRSSRSSGSPTR